MLAFLVLTKAVLPIVGIWSTIHFDLPVLAALCFAVVL